MPFSPDLERLRPLSRTEVRIAARAILDGEPDDGAQDVRAYRLSRAYLFPDGDDRPHCPARDRGVLAPAAPDEPGSPLTYWGME